MDFISDNKTTDNNKIILQRSTYLILGTSLCFNSAFANLSSSSDSFSPIPQQVIQQINPANVRQNINQELSTPVTATFLQSEKAKQKPSVSAGAEQIQFVLSGVAIKGSTVYSKQELIPLFKNYLGKKVSLADLQELANVITVKYRNDGYISSKAIIPPQRINEKRAIIVIQVIEGFISEVDVSGYANHAEDILLGYGEKLKRKRPVRIQDIERYVLLANDLPGFDVKAILVPSKTIIGGTTLTFATAMKKAAASVSYDNRGTRYLGPQQVTASATINDVTHAGDQLTVRTLDTPNNRELRYEQFSYDRPLGDNGMLFSLTGSYTKTRPGFTLKDLDLEGTSKYWSAAVNYPWIRSRRANLYTQLLFDYLNGDTNFQTGEIFNDHIRSLRLRGYFDYLDNAKGFNTASLQFSQGLNILDASTQDQSDPLSRPNGKADYSKANLDLSRLQQLNETFSILAALSGQYSFNQPLLSAEEFGFGGSIFGRGYDPYEISGDDGLAGKAELEINTTPGYSLLQNIQYYLFYDLGVVWNVGNTLDQPARASGTSTGAGGRIKFNRFFSGNLEADKPLTRAVQTEEDAGNNGKAWRYYFGFTASM